MSKLLDLINSIFFPKRCGFCKKSIRESSPLHICEDCLAKLPVTAGSGKLALKGHITYVLSPFCYTKGARNIIYAMKFLNKPMLAHTIAAFMAERLVAVCDLKDIDLVVAVPMTMKKLCRRGYNTAELLAKDVAARCNLPYMEHALLKVRETKAQSGIKENEKRMLNVRDVFTCKHDLEDANILLVDDVFTSGYTVKNCAKALKVAGADKIYVLTAARARCKPSKSKVAYQCIADMVFRKKDLEKEKETDIMDE